MWLVVTQKTYLGLLSLVLASLVSAQTDIEDDEEQEDKDERDWSLILALVVVIVVMGIVVICLIVVICEIRSKKPKAAPQPEKPEIELHSIGIQTDQPPVPHASLLSFSGFQEPPIEVIASIPPSSSSSEPEPELNAFDKILDGLYNLKQESVYGRKATITQASVVAAPREVVLKIYREVEPCLHEYEFYMSMQQGSGSATYNEAKTFLPELVDAGQLTQGDRSCPALVLERGHFSLRDFVIPNKKTPKYVVLSEKSTFFQICNALRFIHRKGYVHGDLHVGSVMFFGSRWKLIDFSSWGNADKEMICSSTFHYTAPEVIQAIAKGLTTTPMMQPVDIWGLGCIAWEILTKKPLLSTTEFTQEVIEEMSFGSIPFPWEGKPAQFWSQIKSQAATKIIQNCLLRDPSQRWSIEKVIQYMQFWS